MSYQEMSELYEELRRVSAELSTAVWTARQPAPTRPRGPATPRPEPDFVVYDYR